MKTQEGSKTLSSVSGPRGKRRLLLLLTILFLAFVVRGLTMRFIRDRLSDPSWFQSGTYAVFDQRARAILRGSESILWIDDPARTDTAIYPPGYPLWLAFVYRLTGEESAVSVQRLQWILDCLSVLLIVGIAVIAYDWTTGMAAGVLAALSPLLALYGAVPLADAPTAWIVLGAFWTLLLSVKHKNPVGYIAVGVLIGMSCWLRPNALLLPLCWSVTLLLLSSSSHQRLASGALIVFGTIVIVTPLLIRNAVAFHTFTPVGLGVGTNLWEGIGDTNRAQEFGAPRSDAELLEQERPALTTTDENRASLYYPDGVRRDRARVSKALTIIVRHPLWYAGVMISRTYAMFKYAGRPAPHVGSAGVNLTSAKCLPLSLQTTPLAMAVNLLGIVQSILRWFVLPLAAYGAYVGFRMNRLSSALLLATILYYVVTLASMHSEIRYGLPMHGLILVWAGLGTVVLLNLLRKFFRKHTGS